MRLSILPETPAGNSFSLAWPIPKDWHDTCDRVGIGPGRPGKGGTVSHANTFERFLIGCGSLAEAALQLRIAAEAAPARLRDEYLGALSLAEAALRLKARGEV